MTWNDLILDSDRLHIIKIRKLALAKIPQAARALASARYHLKIYVCWSQDSDRIRIFMKIVFLPTNIDCNVSVSARTAWGIAGSLFIEFFIVSSELSMIIMTTFIV